MAILNYLRTKMTHNLKCYLGFIFYIFQISGFRTWVQTGYWVFRRPSIHKNSIFTVMKIAAISLIMVRFLWTFFCFLCDHQGNQDLARNHISDGYKISLCTPYNRLSKKDQVHAGHVTPSPKDFQWNPPIIHESLESSDRHDYRGIYFGIYNMHVELQDC